MGMLGISPIVAAVLLIAISVTVGVLLSSWITHWINQRTSQASSACVTDTNYRIDSAKFDLSSNMLTLIITNLGRTGIYGFSVQVLNGTTVKTFNETDPEFSLSPQVNKDLPLKEQQSAIITMNLSGTLSTLGKTAEEVRVLNEPCPTFSAETTNIIKE